MAIGNPNNQQSFTGKLASGYMKANGYKYIVGAIFSFIFGGLLALGGIFLSWVFHSIVIFLIISGFGSLLIVLGIFQLKWSKKMREGKYYQIGRGWKKPR